jgi:hypothetical protein
VNRQYVLAVVHFLQQLLAVDYRGGLVMAARFHFGRGDGIYRISRRDVHHQITQNIHNVSAELLYKPVRVSLDNGHFRFILRFDFPYFILNPEIPQQQFRNILS